MILLTRSWSLFLLGAIPATALAQSGRTMRMLTPAVLGEAVAVAIDHPAAIAGNQFAMAVCSPSHAGVWPVSVPGAVVGALRLDPLAYSVIAVGTLDATGRSPAVSFLVPNSPLLVGASFDVQGADLDGAGLLTLTDDDLELEVAAPPPATLDMVAIAPGSFTMGSASPVSFPEEQPPHVVTIERPFWIGKFEVTQAQYSVVMGNNPSFFVGANRPVERVTWGDAVAYCAALSVQEAAAGRLPTGYEYRLPTEAEGEYCCRAGTTTEWNTGASPSCAQANFQVAGGVYCVPALVGGQTRVVGSYPANALGLHDMHGNVGEFCLDSWDLTANYPTGPVDDPCVTTGAYRIVRSGSWFSGAGDVRSASRHWVDPNLGYATFGFRVVCAPARD